MYPCVVLIRNNTWNDFGYFTEFFGFYIAESDAIIEDLGILKIICSENKDFHTNLPEKFSNLSLESHISRGTSDFYDNLNKFPSIKNTILDCINDYYFKNLNRNKVQKINVNYFPAIQNSLFRDGFDSVISSEYKINATEMLNKIKNLASFTEELDSENKSIILKLLYGSTVTTLEAYLGDAFKYNVINNKNYLLSFVLNYKPSKDSPRFTLSTIGLNGDNIADFVKGEVIKQMNTIIFHKLELVFELYKDILNINLPETLFEFKSAIEIRHDIFHRNGRTIAGTKREINSEELLELIQKVTLFINYVDRKISIQL